MYEPTVRFFRKPHRPDGIRAADSRSAEECPDADGLLEGKSSFQPQSLGHCRYAHSLRVMSGSATWDTLVNSSLPSTRGQNGKLHSGTFMSGIPLRASPC